MLSLFRRQTSWENHMERKSNFGENIRSKRELLNVSQQAAVYKLEIPQPAYPKIEQAKTEVKASQLYKIATYMGISIYKLVRKAIASDVMDDSPLAPVIHIRQWWFRKTTKQYA